MQHKNISLYLSPIKEKAIADFISGYNYFVRDNIAETIFNLLLFVIGNSRYPLKLVDCNFPTHKNPVIPEKNFNMTFSQDYQSSLRKQIKASQGFIDTLQFIDYITRMMVYSSRGAITIGNCHELTNIIKDLVLYTIKNYVLQDIEFCVLLVNNIHTLIQLNLPNNTYFIDPNDEGLFFIRSIRNSLPPLPRYLINPVYHKIKPNELADHNLIFNSFILTKQENFILAKRDIEQFMKIYPGRYYAEHRLAKINERLAN